MEKVDFPLTNEQISEFILEKGYTSYFTLQQAISEMVTTSFIREESTHNRTLYHLTEEGSVRCQIFESGSTLLDLTVSVPTEEEAISVTNNW